MASAAGPSGSAASSRAQPNGASRSRSATGRSSSAPRSCLRLPRLGRRHSRTPPSPPPPQKPRTLRGASRTDTARPRRRPLSPTSRRPRLRRSAPVRLSTSRRTTRSPRTALTCTPTPSRGGTARSRRTRPSRATRRTSTTRSPRRSRPTTSLTPTAVGASSSSTGSASDALTSYPSLASSWARPQLHPPCQGRGRLAAAFRRRR